MKTAPNTAVSDLPAPAVSILMPAFNAAAYISEAIASVQAQTVTDWELIVVDDASADETSRIVESFADPRIRLLRHDANQGPGAARNSALEAARGEWVAPLDADDQWRPERLERLIALARAAGPQYFVSDNRQVCVQTPAGLVPVRRTFEFDYGLRLAPGATLDCSCLADYLNLGSPAVSPLMPRRAFHAYGLRYEPTCFQAEDWELYCRLLASGLRLRLSAEPLYVYRLTPGSVSSRRRYDHVISAAQRLKDCPGVTETDRRLIDRQIKRVERRQAFREWRTEISARHWGAALGVLAAKPWLMGEAFAKIPKSVLYRAQLRRFGGARK